jgi:hypothetical protein
MLSPSIWFLLLALALPQTSEGPGVKITTRSGPLGNSHDRTAYLQADRERLEYTNSIGGRYTATIYGPRLARIVRCDLGLSFELNLDTAEYTSAPYPPKPLTKEEIKARGLETPAARAGDRPTIRVEIKSTDSGERKDMFGHTARRIITTETQIPLEGSHSEPQEKVTDGWYIDFDHQLPCDPNPLKGKQGYISGWVGVSNGRYPMERPEFVYIGEPKIGFPIAVTLTSKSASSAPDAYISTFETRVTEFTEGPLDPALFEIPPGFKHVDHIERSPRPSDLAGEPSK